VFVEVDRTPDARGSAVSADRSALADPLEP
jgi:hypothetical protein